MRKIKLDGDLILPTDVVGVLWPEQYSLRGLLRKKTKVAAVKVEFGVITDYQKCIDSLDPRVYTVEVVMEDTFKLFQVGTYEEPTIFRMNGETPTKFRSHWNNYRIVLLTGK